MNDLTQSELSEKTGVSQGVISSIEAGTRGLSFNTAERLSTYLDICPFELVIEDSFWRATNGEATFEACEDIGKALAKHITRLPESQRQVGLEFACNFGKAKFTIGGSVVNQIVTEHVGRAPSIILNEKETQKQLVANAELGAKSQARRDAEGFGYVKPPAIIMRDKQSFEIEDKLARRPSVFIPVDPSLKTAQRIVEEIPPAPAILLANVNEPKSETKTPDIPPVDDVKDGVPKAPPILTDKSAPEMRHNQAMKMCFQNHIHNGNGGDEKWC